MSFSFNAWRRGLLAALLFSVLGLAFLQTSHLLWTADLLLLALITALMRADTRQALRQMFSGHGTLDLRWIAWPFLVWYFAAILMVSISPEQESSHFLQVALRFPAALFVLALATMRRPDARWLLGGVCVAAIAVFGLAAHDLLVAHMPRADGWVNLPMRFGAWSMLVAALLVLVSALSIHMRMSGRVGLLLLAALALFAGAASGTRSSAFALVVLGLLLVVLRKDRLHRWLLGLGVAGIVLGSMVLASSPAVRKEFRLTDAARDFALAQKQDYATSIGARVVMWQVAWDVFKTHPVIGSGTGTFAPELKRRMDSGAVPRIQEVFQHAHSDILNFMATGGLVGLLAYLGVIAGPFFFFARALWRADEDAHQRLYAALGLLVTVSFFSFGLVNTTLISRFDSTLYPLLICALAMQLLPVSEKSLTAPAKTGNPNP